MGISRAKYVFTLDVATVNRLVHKDFDQQPLVNNRRRPNAPALLTESEPDDDDMAGIGGTIEGGLTVPIPSRSESPQAPRWTSAQEEAAQEEYLLALADQYIYDIVKQCAAAVKALSTYDANRCLTELEKLPYIHQQSAWAVSLVARSHMHSAQYELVSSHFLTSYR
jgi:anaphase-promoting complex subunit 3